MYYTHGPYYHFIKLVVSLNEIGRELDTFFIHRYKMLTEDFKVNNCKEILLIKYPAYSSDITANDTFSVLLLLLRNTVITGK